MSVDLKNAACTVTLRWTAFKLIVLPKVLSIQYDQDSVGYTIFAMDGPCVYTTFIWTGTVPDNGGDYTQAQNDADKADFETNYKPYANGQILDNELDPRLIHRFGNLTSASTSEVLVAARAYNELASQRQCSVQSTSASDDDGTPSGCRQVRITYLDSNYVLKTEDVLTNGTAKVNTVATDIRFIERFEVIKGTAPVGAIQLMDGTTGGANEFCGIPAGADQAFLCHHYVPAGKRAWILGWGAAISNNANFKLKSQQRFGANLVDQNLDLENLFVGTATIPTGRTEFYRRFETALPVGEKCYIRVTVVPGQSSSTVERSLLDLWEDKA